jgi:hypothetical protein
MTDVLDQKEKFAKALKELGDPFKAALSVCDGMPTQHALKMSVDWPHDAEVKAFIKALKDKEESIDNLPSKKDLAEAIWHKMEKCPFPDDYAKLAKLYAEVRGFIEKPDNKPVVNINQNRVMVVKDLGDEEDWQVKAERQQRELLNVSTSRH